MWKKAIKGVSPVKIYLTTRNRFSLSFPLCISLSVLVPIWE